MTVPISVTTLDSFCRDEGIERISLLKIDTEGGELDVLRGAGDLLRNDGIDFIQFEFRECDVFSRVFLKDFYDLLDSSLLSQLGSGFGRILDSIRPLRVRVSVHRDQPDRRIVITQIGPS